STKTSPLVVLENVQAFSTEGLCSLLENVSSLMVHKDFRLEMRPESSTAIVTLLKSIDAEEFVRFCTENSQLTKLKITAKLLEGAHSIKAENIPGGVSTDHITVYFENVSNQGGPKVDVQLLPKERSAITTFCSPKGKA
ncbi:PAR14 polymerase, partial [Crypturellus undulatus]|nr:PAR14 polymerase [Crypturellus undulatus]